MNRIVDLDVEIFQGYTVKDNIIKMLEEKTAAAMYINRLNSNGNTGNKYLIVIVEGPYSWTLYDGHTRDPKETLSKMLNVDYFHIANNYNNIYLEV